jgi:hypothetical protein
MRLGRSSNSDTLGSAAASVQTSGINKSEGETVRGPQGTTVTMHGQVGTARTATVTDSKGRNIGTVHVDLNCIVTSTTPAN